MTQSSESDSETHHKLKEHYFWLARGIFNIKLGSTGNLELALIAFDNAIAILQDNEAGYHGKGIVLTALNRLPEALVAYDSALKINPCDSDSWMDVGDILQKLQMFSEASAAFSKAVKYHTGEWREIVNGLEQEQQAQIVPDVEFSGDVFEQ